MSDLYSFREGPSYQPLTPDRFMTDALDAPLSMASTYFDQAKGGILESFGLGTAIRDTFIPAGNEQSGFGRAIVAAIPGVGLAYEAERQFVQSQINEPQPSMTEEQYKASPHYRENIPWDAGMTEQRAAALASWDDAKKVRDYYAQKRPITAFFGNLSGQALDPINYVPVAGPLVKAAAVERFGAIAGHALTASLDAAGNTAAASLVTAPARATFGDDVSWQTTISQIATAALIGGAFGGIAGAVGKRVEARAMKEAEQRLSTLRTTQEARVALNEGIDALVRGEDVNLSPNATEPLARVSGEVEKLSRAYDEVRANPTGDVRDPLVSITPDEIEGTIVARGAFKDINQVELSRRGWGLVKIIWRHGEESGKPDGLRIKKDDITALPGVIREYEPSSVSADGSQREWRVDRDGRTVVYADSVMDGRRHVVTAYVQDPSHVDAGKPLSGKRAPAAAGSSSDGLNAIRDTDQELSLRPSDGQPRVPATTNVAQSPVIDKTAARPEPLPEGRAQAETRIAKPDNTKALSEQYRVDPQTGAFGEEDEIAQLKAEGRLTEEDEAALAQSQAEFETGVAYAEALKSVAGCLI